MVAQTGKPGTRFKHQQNYLKHCLPGLYGLGLVLLWSPPGWGHGAIATVTPSFAVEATYASGEPMALAQVVVYSPNNADAPWITGQTDKQGKFEFNPDTPGNWDVIIRQAGHGTTVTVPVNISAQAAPQPAHQTAQLIPTSADSPLQRWASAGAGLWGLVGTVLFFSRGKQSS